ncbi:maleate isomerase [Roseibium hamelinense]|uniref:Maleate isomerase n=1 Tax=Roseibium hamelinense TaxID=150831 RepID=A0A562SLX5_9HYPH|nr:ectoine utilization protein EutA [Roseibium hamelinense]MTI45094.1 ectoine utilization protein EutA [Roseibium hamelinense]TWI82361.1 maleate isomerase [Roseibium hamelinense]
MKSPMIQQLPHNVSFEGLPAPKRIGLIALATDQTAERDFARICDPDEAAVYVSRVPYENPTTVENLRLMGPRLKDAADLILPGQPLDVVAYGCTSASVILGNETVFRALKASKPAAAYVTPASAAYDAFTALGVQNLSILTPYSAAVSGDVLAYFRQQGFDITSSCHLGLDDDQVMAHVSHQSLIDAAEATVTSETDGLFVSCTALRSMESIDRIEQRLGKYVVTSNQAMIWRSLRLAGISRPIPGFGRLFHL